MKLSREEKDLIYWDMVLDYIHNWNYSETVAETLAEEELGYKAYYSLSSYEDLGFI